MIVRDDGSDALLITQCDHAALAGRVLAAVRSPGWLARPTREATLFATYHHDDGWREADAAPAWNAAAGRPHDFLSLPAATRQAVWPRGIAHLAQVSSYAAALLAQHALTVFRPSQGDPVWQPFLRAMETARSEHFDRGTRAGFVPSLLDPAASDRLWLLRDYAYLAWADMVSLIFCNDWRETFDVDVFRIWSPERGVVCVAPDPFDGHEVTVQVRARRLRLSEIEQATLAEAVMQAPDEQLVGKVCGRALVS